jgi:hypothetical protein
MLTKGELLRWLEPFTDELEIRIVQDFDAEETQASGENSFSEAGDPKRLVEPAGAYVRIDVRRGSFLYFTLDRLPEHPADVPLGRARSEAQELALARLKGGGPVARYTPPAGADPMLIDCYQLMQRAREALPRRSVCRVAVWEERDRLHVHAFQDDENRTVAEWWDDDARQMFEDGFFERGPRLEASVLDHLAELGRVR